MMRNGWPMVTRPSSPKEVVSYGKASASNHGSYSLFHTLHTLKLTWKQQGRPVETTVLLKMGPAYGTHLHPFQRFGVYSSLRDLEIL